MNIVTTQQTKDSFSHSYISNTELDYYQSMPFGSGNVIPGLLTASIATVQAWMRIETSTDGQEMLAVAVSLAGFLILAEL